ncbi:MAG: FtsX-like permease family protein [Sandaracinaceae bacterium]|nr:MAG: FtsX-like permease family protein [Sandaracinaceae bacterium]
MLSALDRKLFRDLGTLRGQVLTIALVVAAGIATYVTLRGTYSSLFASRDAYYERQRMADVFATAKRVPRSVARRIERLDGVARVYPRVSELVYLPFPGEPEPSSGLVASIPSDGSPPPMNGLEVMRGRWPEPGHADEVLLLDNFATAREIDPGDTLVALLNGSRRELRVVGTALSPEYVFALEPGNAMPEPDAFAVIWMFEDAASAVFQMEGAFDDLVLTLQPGASEDAVIDAVDRVLEPYGGFGALPRSKQESNYFLTQELLQLESMATFVPFIFLAVAAFLLNIVLARLIHLQRPQIAALKALGYPDLAIGLHYLKLVSVVVFLGSLVGILLGWWLGSKFTELYTAYFRMPLLRYQLDPQVALVGVGVSLFAAVVGASIAVRQVVRLPPAEAMRPPPPARYTRSIFERLGVMSLFGTSARMVFREITRRPMRTALSAVGISMALAILVAGRSGMDAFEHLVALTFQRAMTEDLAVQLVRPMPERVVGELGHLPGVTYAEGMRAVPVRFVHGAVHRDAVIFGRPDRLEMRRLYDTHGDEIELPREGLLIESTLARLLGVGVGDAIEVQVREGDRGTHRVPIAGTIDEMFGLQAYMHIDSLSALVGEERTVNTVLLDIDPAREDLLRRRLRARSGVQSLFSRTGLIARTRAQTGETWGAMTFILTLFAVVIAIGVVYNNARVALSMRSRDLASLRVLGFTRREISAVLLGELAVQVLLAIPIGLLLGTWMAEGMMAMADPERYRMTAIVSSQTYAFATAVILGAGLVSALMVRRKLDHLDLIGVLKTRE